MPQRFTYDGTMCCICLNPSGHEGGWALGTCPHMFHPPCLITPMHINRRCPICRAPFYQRLYQLFNLITYMPKSWECNPTNTLTNPKMWGLNQPLDWWIRTPKFAWNGANTIRGLTAEETIVVAQHFYPDQHNGHQNCF
jgi:hypothetical protein